MDNQTGWFRSDATMESIAEFEHELDLAMAEVFLVCSKENTSQPRNNAKRDQVMSTNQPLIQQRAG